MATAAAAATAAAIRRVTSYLMSNNAVSEDRAVRFVPDRHIQRRVLARLVRRGVIVETEPDNYYLDLPAYDDWRRSRRKRVAFALAGVVAIAAIAALIA